MVEHICVAAVCGDPCGKTRRIPILQSRHADLIELLEGVAEQLRTDIEAVAVEVLAVERRRAVGPLVGEAIAVVVSAVADNFGRAKGGGGLGVVAVANGERLCVAIRVGHVGAGIASEVLVGQSVAVVVADVADYLALGRIHRGVTVVAIITARCR